MLKAEGRRHWLAVLLLGAIAIVAKLRRSSAQKGTPPSDGDPTTQDDNPDPSVVDEWGVESFPASDPPQSW